VSRARGFLETLEVQPALGRTFNKLDDSPEGERTVILTGAWWKARFGGDPSVIGRRILIDGNATEVIGILPASFTFIDRRFSTERFTSNRKALTCCGVHSSSEGVKQSV